MNSVQLANVIWESLYNDLDNQTIDYHNIYAMCHDIAVKQDSGIKLVHWFIVVNAARRVWAQLQRYRYLVSKSIGINELSNMQYIYQGPYNHGKTRVLAVGA